jgi:Flp pilus assembly protein TadG
MVVNSEEGQSLLEFVFGLPLLIGLSLIMIRVNESIQMSIVAQRYVRSQVLFLAQNSPEYPRRDLARALTAANRNQVIMGLREQPALDGEVKEEPKASTNMISRSKSTSINDLTSGTAEEPAKRSNVRIRNTVSLCTQSYFVNAQGGPKPLSADTLVEPFKSSQFEYCVANLQGKRRALDE